MSPGGLSKARLGRMHDVMAGHAERGNVPGVVTLVGRRGEAHVDAVGTKAMGGSEPMRRDTIFRVAAPSPAAKAVLRIAPYWSCTRRPARRGSAAASDPSAGPHARS